MFLKNKKKFLLFLATASLVLAVFILPASVWALDVGINQAAKIGLGAAGPKVIIVKVVQVALGFLSLLAVILVLYAGFVWMTSGGNEAKVEQAKKILRNALIGLLIILASFGIATFFLNRWQQAAGPAGGGGGGGGAHGGGMPGLGLCAIESVYPAPDQSDVPRNTVIIVTFREPASSTTIFDPNNNDIVLPESVKIYPTADPANPIANLRATTTDNRTFVFLPPQYLGSPSEQINYTVYLSNDIRKLNGDGIFAGCRGDYYQWHFTVSTKLDLTPPQIKSVFPPPDDEEDLFSYAGAQPAVGAIAVNSQPQTAVLASASAPAAAGGSPAAELSGAYNCLEDGTIQVVIANTSPLTAQVSGVAGVVSGDDVSDGAASLGCGLTLTLTSGSFSAGNSWTIAVTAAKAADTLTVGSQTYTFVSSAASGQQILIGADINETAANIANALVSHPDVSPAASGNVVNLTARVAGRAGNNIALESSASGLAITPMAGGADSQRSVVPQGKRDKPRNTGLQVNFSEPVYPPVVSGLASAVANYIRVVNNAAGAGPDGGACAVNADCLSYHCDQTNGHCVGNYLSGRFSLSNQYQTVEFYSDVVCGVNSCGQAVYCLPANSNLRVELAAAELKACGGADDCLAYVPFDQCAGGHCQNAAGENYPLAQVPPNGIVDMAFNSLDGNRDGTAQGPLSFYNENSPAPTDGDSYLWSFWLSDQIDLTPATITAIIQLNDSGLEQDLGPNAHGADLNNPILINFSKLMMSSSLRTGQARVFNGRDYISHQLINLKFYSNQAVGYWLTKTNIDSSAPPDGEPDWTQARLNHTPFAPTTSYRAQVGSGVRDIYQNCFLPASGPDGAGGSCQGEPSCCNGAPINSQTCD